MRSKVVSFSYWQERDDKRLKRQVLVNFLRTRRSSCRSYLTQVYCRLFKRYGKSWSAIAAKLPGRTPKQVRDRWNHFLAPGIKRDVWSLEEDLLLISLHRKHGNRWTKIARKIPGRTDNSVKNRWYGAARSKRNDSSLATYIKGLDAGGSNCSDSSDFEQSVDEKGDERGDIEKAGDPVHIGEDEFIDLLNTFL